MEPSAVTETLPTEVPTETERLLEDAVAELAAILSRLISDMIVAGVSAWLPEVVVDSPIIASASDADRAAAAVWEAGIGEALGPIQAAYDAGSMSVWLTDKPVPAGASPTDWAKVVNVDAVDFARSAENRLSGVGQGTWAAIRTQVRNAIDNGESTEDLKRRLEDITKFSPAGAIATGPFSEFRADTVARTETMTAYNGGTIAGQRALGEFGPTFKEWHAAEDARTRPAHAEVSGTIVPIGESFTVGGFAMDHPHDPAGGAGNSVNCRCVLLYYYDDDPEVAHLVDKTQPPPQPPQPVVVQPQPTVVQPPAPPAPPPPPQTPKTRRKTVGEPAAAKPTKYEKGLQKKVDAVGLDAKPTRDWRESPTSAKPSKVAKDRVKNVKKVGKHVDEDIRAEMEQAGLRRAFGVERDYANALNRRDSLEVIEGRRIVVEHGYDNSFRGMQAFRADRGLSLDDFRQLVRTESRAYADAAAEVDRLWDLRQAPGLLDDEQYAAEYSRRLVARLDAHRGTNTVGYKPDPYESKSLIGTHGEQVWDRSSAYLPREWLERAVDGDGQVTIGIMDSQRARGYAINQRGGRLDPDTGMVTGDTWQVHIPLPRQDDVGLGVHEVMHVMEEQGPHTRQLEWAFLHGRARGGPKSLETLTGNPAYRVNNERAFDGDFTNAYTGRVYRDDPEAPWEVMSMGYEGLVTGSTRHGVYDDEDLMHFVIGVLFAG